jgi:hypothetical protein
MITVNSIMMPESFKALWNNWHSGINCKLYAVASTGGLTIGTLRPAGCDCDEKWYLAVWRDLSRDIGYALRTAKLNVCPSRVDCVDIDGLIALEAWVCWQVSRLELSYGLSDWTSYDD